MNLRRATRMRVRAIIRKESLQILRDPSSIAIAFIMPLVLLLLFGYGVSLDARNIRLALVVEQPDANTASLTGAFQQSEFFDTVSYRHINQADKALVAHDVDGIVWLRSNFSDRLLTEGDAVIGVFVNGIDANQGRITQGYRRRLAGLVNELRASAGARTGCAGGTCAAHLVQPGGAQPQFPGARLDRGDHDPHRRHAHLDGGGA